MGDFKEYQIEFEDSPANDPSLAHSFTVTDTAYDDGTMPYFGIYGEHSAPFTRKYWVRARDLEGNLSPKSAQPLSVLLSQPTIFRTEFTVHTIVDSAAQSGCLDSLAFALDVTSSPDSLIRIQWHARGYYHNSETILGRDWTNQHDSLGVSVGAPHRDTLSFTRRTLDELGSLGSQVVWDSVFVSAMLVDKGGLIHAVTVHIRLDSSGCFHPSAAIDRSNGKPPL